MADRSTGHKRVLIKFSRTLQQPKAKERCPEPPLHIEAVVTKAGEPLLPAGKGVADALAAAGLRAYVNANNEGAGFLCVSCLTA